MTAYENLLAHLKSNNDMFINGHVLITKIDENVNGLYLQNDCSILNMWPQSSQNVGLDNRWERGV
jgi:flagellar biosynthesis regulator FlbT